MYLKSINIKRYRNFSDTTINFQDGLNIIVGSNNSGKTNLLRAINLLDNSDKTTGTVDDFNKNDLYYHREEYLKKPPTIEIIYYIEHTLDLNGFDDGILRLKNFIVYNNDGKVMEDNATGKYVINADILLKFELDNNYLNEYKDIVKSADTYEKYIFALEKVINRYNWTYYNTTSQFQVRKTEVSNIFNIDFIKADRKTDEMMPQIREYVKKQIDDSPNKVDLKYKVSNTFKEEFSEITKSINERIRTECDDVGIKNGNSTVLANFKFDSSAAQYFGYKLEDSDLKYEIPVDNNGLGYNNLIQIYSIIRFKIDNDYNILLIEEPEAHLHPAMQYKLLKYLSKLKQKEAKEPNSKLIKNQIFITTHSVNISAAANLDDMISMGYHRDIAKCEFVVETQNLKDKFSQEKYKDSKEHLAKFLDVTRSDMLFTKKLILVEGLAEKLLMPAFARRLGINYDVEHNHISVVEVGGITFKHFLTLFVGTRNKVLCFRDCDYKYFNEDDNLESLDNYKRHLSSLCLIDAEFQTENIKTKTQINLGSTFENELFIDNFNKKCVVITFFKYVAPENLHPFIDKYGFSIEAWKSNIDEITNISTKKKIVKNIEPYYKKYSNVTEQKDRDDLERVFFANLFLSYVANKKGDFALWLLTNNVLVRFINIPTYIQEGLKWLKQ